MQPSAELYPWISAGVIAWGLLDCFFGFRLFKIMLAVTGGLAGVVFGQAAGAALGLGPAGEIGGMIVVGLLGAGLMYLLYIAAVFVSGFLFGLALGVLLLSHFHQMVALLGGCVLGLIGGFLAVKLQRVLIILSTSLTGAFRAIVALSYFTGRIDWAFISANRTRCRPCSRTTAGCSPPSSRSPWSVSSRSSNSAGLAKPN